MSMARPFVFVLHHHQPIGNVPEVLRSAYERCYLPLLDALDAHPSLKVTLHYSGALLEWLVRETPQLVSRVKEMVAAGRVEVLGGAFYDPILTLLPDHDVQGQIEMMAMFSERYFGVRPKGVWLAERVFDPDLPRLLAPAGARYTFVDDTHFRAAGIDEGGATGFWMTERAGNPLGIFPIARRLRYAIPFHAPEEAVRSIADGPGEGALVYADDAEKLGFWPETHEWVFGKGWLDRFFTALENAQERGEIETVLPADLTTKSTPAGRVYPSGGGYEELVRWAGGNFSAFLARYPEADRMHKKMLRVSERLQAAMEVAIADSDTGRLEGDLGDLLGTAQRDLYRGQCACAYWHGLFGGLYLGHLRRSVYSALIHADAILDRLAQGEDDFLAYEERDVDLCGKDEVVVSNRTIDVVVKPSAGGVVTELDHKPHQIAIADAVARHREPYHAELDEPPAADDEPRGLFVDRFLPKEASKAIVDEPAAHDLAKLSRRPYEVVSLDVEGEALSLVMKTKGDGVPLEIEKTIVVPMEGATVEARYTIENAGDARVEGILCVELTTTFVGAPGDADGDATIDAEANVELSIVAEGARIEARGLEGMVRREDGIAPALLGRVTTCLFETTLAPGARTSLSIAVTLS